MQHQSTLHRAPDGSTIAAFTLLNTSDIFHILTDMMAATRILLTLAFVCIIQAQRPFYAGLRPIGYPADPTVDLSNRFGETDDAPIEALGDKNLVNRLDQMPVDKQPFWYLNWRLYQALRQQPQTYPQRPNNFIDRV